MTADQSFWLAVQVVTLANIVVLTVGFCLSIVAVRGFAGAPINRMLKPLPVVFLSFILVNVPWTTFGLMLLPGYTLLYAATFTIGMLAAVTSALQAVYLLTERRDL